MEESYETFEEELGPSRAEPPPQKPVRQIRRPEMYATRKAREEMAAVPQQPRAEPKILPREPSVPKTTTLRKALSIQNLAQMDTPWENVTLNRCLFVAITILVLTSGCQRLHEVMRGQGAAEEEEEEVAVSVRRSGALRHRGEPLEPEKTLLDVLLGWLPDLDDEEDDEEDEDEDGGVKRKKSKRGAKAERPGGLRNKPMPEKLMKREGKLIKDKRAKKAKDEEVKAKKEIEPEEPEEEEDDEGEDEEDEEIEEPVPKKKKKTQK